MHIYDYLRDLSGLEDKTDAELSTIIFNDIDDLLDLQDRIILNKPLYEEDRTTIDHILDYLEILLKLGGVI